MIDIGANLAHDSFDHDRDAVIARAWSAGLTRIIVTGSSMPSSETALALAKAHPGAIFSTAGLHPHHAADWDQDCASKIRQLAQSAELVAVGECGLDYFRDLSPRDAQRRAFTEQLQIAVQLGKPVFLHQRDAHEDFLAILHEYRNALSDACVHCFTDTRSAAEDYLALDCHIGITGWICDERRGKQLLDIVPLIPAHRLMVETDAPYLMPRSLPKALMPRDPRRNEPAFLPWVIQAIAQARGEDADAVAQFSRRNAENFFRLPSG